MTIRKAVDADLAGVSACLADAFEQYRAEYTAGGFADTVLTIESARRRLDLMTVLVADDRGSIVGTIGYQAGPAGEGHLRGMAVLPSRLGGGIAPLLLEAAEAGLRDAGCTRVTLDTTRPLARAIAFYERRGYRPTGVVRDFYGMELIEYEKMLT